MVCVSVIVPAYNAGKFIENCINSILRQSFHDFEIVVVNDGSTDNTLEKICCLAQKDNRIKVINQKNSGVSAARNTAISNASGKYLTMVDADDDLPPTALANLVELMEDDVDLVIGSHNQVRLRKKPYIEKIKNFEASEIGIRFREFDPMVWCPWGKLFRHSVIKENNLRYDMSISYGEDHIFNILFAKHMKGRAIATDKIVYNYYFIRGGLCAQYYPNRHELQKYVLKGLFEFFGGVDKFPREYYIHYVGCYLTGCMDYYCVWCNYKDTVKKIEEIFEVYQELLTPEIVANFFTNMQQRYLHKKDFRGMTKDYITKNLKKIIWSKIKRRIRIILEIFCRIVTK